MKKSMLSLLLVIVFHCGYVQMSFADELASLKSLIQKTQQENLLLKEQLNKQQGDLNQQQKLIGQLLEKVEAIASRKVSGVSVDEAQITRIVEDVLEEKQEEEQLAGMFSEGGLDGMIFHGYVDLEWKDAEFDRGDGGTRDHNYFDNHHFNLWFGYRLADNLLAKSEIEIEHGADAWKLEFGQLEWRPFSSDNLELLMGKLLVPLGIENPVHASVWNKLISRPLPSISIIPGTYADIGMEFRGWLPSYDEAKLRYHFYVVNGFGDDNSDGIYEQSALKRSRDNNNNKALGVQGAFFPVKGVEVGASGYWAKWDDADERDTFVLVPHFVYVMGPIDIRAEYMYQYIENANGPSSQDAVLQGWYVQGAYKLSGLKMNNSLDKWEVVSRYDWMHNEDGVKSLKQGSVPMGKSEDRISLGLVYRPQEWLQFKSEFLHRTNEGLPDNNGLGLQAVVNW